MPELPEIEVTRRGIAPYIEHKIFQSVVVRQPKLRQTVDPELHRHLCGQTVLSISRRAKYLLFHTSTGCLMIHLGMSGSLRVFSEQHPPPEKHDHADFVFHDNTLLRFRDPRRFGALLWFSGSPEQHSLLRHLGHEPLSENFNAAYLAAQLTKQSRAVKSALMDNRVVVGVGNIYANESLFYAGIHPMKPANQLHPQEYEQLVIAIKDVLHRAINAGGSTLRDFVNSDGKSGYFQQQYAVYGRTNEPCRECGAPISKTTIAQRSTFFCSVCQH
ncbi:bifunctional DNA-formamidopyrimidine glycosylase/DNA-(apurinic or apyrimidinic site) lyase [Stenoxybacter acetivorans]|uniref:bifunctional DNA-formamidopyrimidine glycosylase/DNA-(apurinic or apyrimidinic site) lyase n=1 Tax=Stenoxybacter acetivorans TaxID=422441 RepID=UPI00055B36FB|nr:bifunctional DNA-formamidopyrimidine glycosylase/DNA-(apurinic or apyrimidinic site) lyase [Stenoxybacter acetivorans]